MESKSGSKLQNPFSFSFLKIFINTLYLKYNMAEEIVKPEEDQKKTEVSLAELIRELIQGKKEQKAKLIDVA